MLLLMLSINSSLHTESGIPDGFHPPSRSGIRPKHCLSLSLCGSVLTNFSMADGLLSIFTSMCLLKVDLPLHFKKELVWSQRDFLLSTAPFILDNSTTSKIVREGKVEDLTGALLMTPEMNLRDLTTGEQLIDVFREVSKVIH